MYNNARTAAEIDHYLNRLQYDLTNLHIARKQKSVEFLPGDTYDSFWVKETETETEIDKLSVLYLGGAVKSLEKGVICNSYNAG